MRHWYKPLAVVLGLAFSLSIWQGAQSGDWSPIVFAVSFLTIASGLPLGALFCRAAGLEDDEGIDILMVLTIGILLYELLLLALAFFSPFPFYLNVLGLALLLVSLGLPAFRQRMPVVTVSPMTALCAVVCILATGFWSIENLRPLAIGNEEVVVHAWQDMFIHARLVAMFGLSQGVTTLSNFDLSGQPMSVYHYASYMIPAAILSLRGGTAYSLAASLIAPLGVVLTGFAAYGFGKLLTGRETVGLLACCALLLVPDASYFGLGNRWTGYNFFQQVGVAGPYAVAAMGLGWALVLRGLAKESWHTIMAGFLLCGLSAFFKSQIFLAYAMIPLLFVWVFHPKLSGSARISLIAATVGSYVAALAFMAHIADAPTLAFSTSGFRVNLQAILANFPAEPRLMWQNLFGNNPGAGKILLVGAPMLLLSNYGLSILALGPAWWLAGTRQLISKPLAWFPLWIIIPHLILALATTPNSGPGDPFEVFHKTFVWPVWAITVWIGVIVGLWVGDALRAKYSFATISAALILCTLPIIWYGSSVQSGIIWSQNAMDLKLPRGLYDAALFVRNNSHPGEVVQLSDNDPYLMFPAFCERPLWVIRSGMNLGTPPPEVIKRFNIVASLRKQAHIASVFSSAQLLGIQWWVSKGPVPADWAPKSVMTSSRGGKFSVFQIK